MNRYECRDILELAADMWPVNKAVDDQWVDVAMTIWDDLPATRALSALDVLARTHHHFPPLGVIRLAGLGAHLPRSRRYECDRTPS